MSAIFTERFQSLAQAQPLRAHLARQLCHFGIEPLYFDPWQPLAARSSFNTRRALMHKH